MHTSSSDANGRLQVLENWLPLAQDANALYSWGYDPLALEALILKAAPALLHVRSSLEARVILWHYHVWNKTGKI
jgi:hypothetical protein